MESSNYSTTMAPTPYSDLTTGDSLNTSELLPSPSPTPYTAITIPPATRVILGSILMIGFIVGMVVNPLVINLFRKEKKIHSFTNMYVLALSSSDLLMALVGLSTAAISTCAGRWVFGDIGCVFHGFSVTFLGLLNLNLFTAIAVDRYLVIVRPNVRARLSNRAVKVIIAGCVVVAFVWALLPLGGWMGISSYTYEGIRASCSLNWISERVPDKVYIVLLFVVFFALPVAAICVAYTSIYLKVREVTSASSLVANPTIAEKNAQVERKVAITFFLVFFCFLVSWTPYAVVSLIATTGYSASISPLTGTIPAVFAKMAVVWNPFIYVATNQVIRECFIQLYAPGSSPQNTGAPPSRVTNGNATVGNNTGVSPQGVQVLQSGVAPQAPNGAELQYALHELSRGQGQGASGSNIEQINQARGSVTSIVTHGTPQQQPPQRRMAGRQGSFGTKLPTITN